MFEVVPETVIKLPAVTPANWPPAVVSVMVPAAASKVVSAPAVTTDAVPLVSDSNRIETGPISASFVNATEIVSSVSILVRTVTVLPSVKTLSTV